MYIENSPTSYEPEDDSTSEVTTGKKKKKAGALGSFALEKKPASNEQPTLPSPEEDFWAKFKTEKPDSAIAKLAEAEPETAPEAEAPDEELGEEEKQLAAQAIVEQAQDEATAETAPADPAEQAAVAAVENFRNRIVENGQDVETAYQETLAELDPDTKPPVDSEAVTTEPEPATRPFAEFPENHAVPLDSSPLPESDPQQTEPPESTPPPPPAGPAPPFANEYAEPDQPHPPVAPLVETGGRKEYQPDLQHGNPAAAALLGGIIGYFIGRRRGRIRTEKKLLPVQKKLKQQVEDLQWDIKAKEKTIYRVAAEKAQSQPSNVEVVPLPLPQKQEKRRSSPEVPKAERIGQMLVTAQSSERAKAIEKPTEKTKPKPEKAPEKNDKTVATMNRTELLELSDKIIIDGTSLRQIYETKLVGERGLRRLIVEHLQGGDVHKLLRQEITEREIDFERDPAIRDQAVSSATLSGGKATSPKLDKLLEKAAVTVADSQEQAAFYRARAQYQQQQHDANSKRRRAMDITLATVIATLTAILITIYFARG